MSDTKTKSIEENYNEIVQKYKLNWIIKIPIFFIKLVYFLNQNKISYLLDNFWKNKILKINKIQEIN